jgi:transposase
VFLRVATKKTSNNTYRYLQLCDCVRINGVPRDRILFNFGNLDRLSPSTLSSLADKFGALAGDGRVRASTLSTERVWEYGTAAVALHLWDEFKLSERLERLWASRRRSFDPVPYLQMVVANRLIDPRSKLGVFQWVERVALPEAEKACSLHQYYRSLDDLLQVKEPLEEELWGASRDLFNLEVDLVFYDITSTYFEGQGPESAAYGYSRDKRSDLKQVVVALACDRKGFPIAHEVLPGNKVDVTTVVPMLETLGKRFAIRRCVFVGDSGMVSEENLKALDEAGYGYVVAVKRKKLSGMEKMGEAPLSAYEETGHGLRVLLGEVDGELRRLGCCYSEERAKGQRSIREARVGRGRQGLAKLKEMVDKGYLKAADKIIARAAEHLVKTKAKRYLEYSAKEGEFVFRVKEEVIVEEERMDGKYFLLVKAKEMKTRDIVDAYYTLQEVERAFRDMKDFLKLRPIYHWKERRVKAHIFACVLAYLLEKALEERLERAKVAVSARKALDLLSTIHLVENRLGETTIRSISRPSPMAQSILKAVGMPPLPSTVSYKAADPPSST